jgi:hypothetical protein
VGRAAAGTTVPNAKGSAARVSVSLTSKAGIGRDPTPHNNASTKAIGTATAIGIETEIAMADDRVSSKSARESSGRISGGRMRNNNSNGASARAHQAGHPRRQIVVPNRLAPKLNSGTVSSAKGADGGGADAAIGTNSTPPERMATNSTCVKDNRRSRLPIHRSPPS